MSSQREVLPCWTLREGCAAGCKCSSLISMDCVLTLPEVFICYFLFFPAFWWCFILNHSIKLTRNLRVGFGSLLSHPAVAQSQTSQHVCIFLFSWEAVLMGWVVAVSVPAVLMLPSDFTRSPAKVRMAAVTPRMLLKHCATCVRGSAWALAAWQILTSAVERFHCDEMCRFKTK